MWQSDQEFYELEENFSEKHPREDKAHRCDECGQSFNTIQILFYISKFILEKSPTGALNVGKILVKL